MVESRRADASWWTALKVAGIFLVASALWIVGSDAVVARLAPTPEVLAAIQTYKGLVYTAVMGLLIFIAVEYSFRREQQVWAALRGSEAKYRRLVESLDREYFIFSHGADGVFTYVSPSIENVLGYTQDEYVQHYADTFTDSPANTAAARHSEASIRGERQPTYEIEVRHKDGSTRQMNVIEIPVFHENGKVLAVEGIARDITEQKRAETTLRASEERYRSLFEAANDAVFVVEGDRFVACNSRAMETFGCTEEQILHETFIRFSPPRQPDGFDSRERVLELIAEAHAGRPQFFEWEHCRYDGSPFDAEVSLNRFEVGGEYQLFAIVRDITDRKRAEEALAASEHMYRTLFESAGDAIATFRVTPKGFQYVDANAREIELLGCQREELHRRSPVDFSPPNQPDGRSSLEKAMEVVTATLAGETQRFEWKHCRKDGTLLDSAVTLTPVEVAGETLILGIRRDITEQKRTADALAASEQLYRTLFETAGDGFGILKLTADGIRFADCNARQAEIFGCSRDEIVGRSPVDFSPATQPDGRSSTEKAMEIITAAFAGTPQSFEWKHRTKDGTPLDIEVRLNSVEIEGEQVMLAMNRDVTERKRAEEALRDSRTKLRAIFDHHYQLTGLLDPEGRLLAANKTALEFAGVEETEAIGHYFWEGPWWDRSQEPELRSAIERAAGGEFVRFETTHPSPDGGIRDFDFSLTPVRDDDGRVVYLVPEGRDITEAKQNEQALRESRDQLEQRVRDRTAQLEIRTRELEEANDRLQEMDRLKSMFIASMSHELRTPLNSIIGFTGIVLQGLSGELTEKQRDQLSRAYGSAKHLLALISDVIDISKIEAGRIDVFPTEFDLDGVVDEAVETLRPEAVKKGLSVTVNVPTGLKLFLDRRLLLQCLLNFLSNAVKYSEEGSITVSARETDDEIEIRVGDTGIGIAEEDIPRVFEAFERLESHLRIKAGGAGLGLYLTKKIAAELLGGAVSVRSELGQGSEFTLRVARETEQT